MLGPTSQTWASTCLLLQIQCVIVLQSTEKMSLGPEKVAFSVPSRGKARSRGMKCMPLSVDLLPESCADSSAVCSPSRTSLSVSGEHSDSLSRCIMSTRPDEGGVVNNQRPWLDPHGEQTL